MSTSKRPAPEIHKFGGASLADATAFRHAVEIVRGRPGPRVVVCSAPSGVTDSLLGMAKLARGGQDAGLAAQSIALRRRYLTILGALVPGKKMRRPFADEVERLADVGRVE